LFLSKNARSYSTIDDKYGLLSTVNKLLPLKTAQINEEIKNSDTLPFFRPQSSPSSIITPQKYTSHIYDKEVQLYGDKMSKKQNVCKKKNLIQQTKSSEILMV